MRSRFIPVAALAGTAAAMVLWTWPVPTAVEPPPARLPRSAAPATPAAPAAAAPGALRRNLFEFGEAPRAAPPPAAATAVAPAPFVIPAAPVVARVRCVGLVRRGDQLRAAIAIDGNVAVLAVGEEGDGYLVLSIDEESGVRVREPDGTKTTLPLQTAP